MERVLLFNRRKAKEMTEEMLAALAEEPSSRYNERSVIDYRHNDLLLVKAFASADTELRRRGIYPCLWM